MNKDDHLKQHLELCKRIYLRMLQEGTWPWSDSQNPEDLVESEDINPDL